MFSWSLSHIFTLQISYFIRKVSSFTDEISGSLFGYTIYNIQLNILLRISVIRELWNRLIYNKSANEKFLYSSEVILDH